MIVQIFASQKTGKFRGGAGGGNWRRRGVLARTIAALVAIPAIAIMADTESSDSASPDTEAARLLAEPLGETSPTGLHK